MDIAGLAAQMASLQWHLPLTTAAGGSHLQGAVAPFVGSLWRETWPCTKPLPCSASNGLPTMNRIVIAQVSPVRGMANPKPRRGCHVRGATSFWRPTSGRGGNTIRACTQTTSMSWVCQRTGGNGMMRGGTSNWHRQSRKNLLQAQGLAGLRQGQGHQVVVVSHLFLRVLAASPAQFMAGTLSSQGKAGMIPEDRRWVTWVRFRLTGDKASQYISSY